MAVFICKSYHFDHEAHEAVFEYGFDSGEVFYERVLFRSIDDQYDRERLNSALFLAFILAGISYYKTAPCRDIVIEQGSIDEKQARFFTTVYQEGLGQFAYENGLSREDFAVFRANATDNSTRDYSKETGTKPAISMQSGGKDSILTACLLAEKGRDFSPLFISTSDSYPSVLDELSDSAVLRIDRHLDVDALRRAQQKGGRNGHVPVTYILESYAIVQAILLNVSTIYTSIAHEGEEPHSYIGDLPVNHQWSKTWAAEVMMSEYVQRYILSNFIIGSPLRSMSELRVAELFVQLAWEKYGNKFSSCNVANYGVGHAVSELRWCGNCPKCVNTYVLFAPFIDAKKLTHVFGDKDLFEQESLQETFRGLFGVGGVKKPFECVGEIEELRYAYALAQKKGGYGAVSFDVPAADFEYKKSYQSLVEV